MNLFRLAILSFLFYILYRLIVGGLRKKSVARRKSDKNLPKHDTLVEDPVCHTYVPQKQALTIEEKDKTVYFCSAACRDKYLAEKGEEQ